ncbi:hypothetical protein ACG2F4_18785 [Halalkalibaculum sp. DA3122]
MASLIQYNFVFGSSKFNLSEFFFSKSDFCEFASESDNISFLIKAMLTTGNRNSILLPAALSLATLQLRLRKTVE